MVQPELYFITFSTYKNTIFDQYRQTWISAVNNCSKLEMYSNFKNCLSYECEKYLSAISNVKL